MSEADKPRDASAQHAEERARILPTHGISLDLPLAAKSERPPAVKHMSEPSYISPIRHHRRAPSRTKHVKETLNARTHYGSSDDDGSAFHRINQYVIKQEIGRGSFGAVHLAEDQYGSEFAVKEFSKSRLRKRAQSNLLRRPHQKRPSQHLAAGMSFNSPLHRVSASDRAERKNDNALDLIKEEIAIMKKLDHNNLVNLIEVLDDPEEDSLYMVLEMCKKGVVMKVDLEQTADPYDEETCRCWFRDMILGIEYLHAQGIIHRDLKPDNCLITSDDVLKIVDFGVSEMFEKQSDMATAKSAGSPAFMPPELCVAKHGQVSGRAADIWSMGVTLYCLRYGRIPFERSAMMELYQAIRCDETPLDGEEDEVFADLMRRLLEKDPEKRITMDQLRDHAWVTKGGSDPLLPAKENCADLIEPPTEAEKDHAITGKMLNLLVVMKAVKRFKRLLLRRRPELMDGLFGRSSRIVAPPQHIHPGSTFRGAARSSHAHDRKPLEGALAAEGIHHELEVSDDLRTRPKRMDVTGEPSDDSFATPDNISSTPTSQHEKSNGRAAQETEANTHHANAHVPAHIPPAVADHVRGHAHDPLTDTLFLQIGAGVDTAADLGERAAAGAATDVPVISESPGAVEMNVYETAYEEEMQRVLARRGKSATLFLTRRVEHNEKIRGHESVVDHARGAVNAAMGGGGGAFAGLVRKAKENAKAKGVEEESSDAENGDEDNDAGKRPERGSSGLAGLVKKAKEKADEETKDPEEE